MSDKTKAELVVELVGDVNIARLEGDRETIYVGIVDYQTGGLDVDSNPNTPEALEKALRVLSGEVVELPTIPDAIQQILDRVELQQKESGSTELDNTAHHLWYAHKGSLPRMEFPEETFDELVERVEKA